MEPSTDWMGFGGFTGRELHYKPHLQHSRGLHSACGGGHSGSLDLVDGHSQIHFPKYRKQHQSLSQTDTSNPLRSCSQQPVPIDRQHSIGTAATSRIRPQRFPMRCDGDAIATEDPPSLTCMSEKVINTKPRGPSTQRSYGRYLTYCREKLHTRKKPLQITTFSHHHHLLNPPVAAGSWCRSTAR